MNFKTTCVPAKRSDAEDQLERSISAVCQAGGVLSQAQDGQERVIAYFSKTLSKAERNFCVTRWELLAIVKTLEHFHKYLYGQQFYLHTDHSALTWLLSFKNLEGPTACWIQHLQEYNFTSEHRQGRRNNNTDALSRRPCPERCSHCQKIEQQGKGLKMHIITTTAADGWDRASLRREQLADKLRPLLQEAEAGQRRSQPHLQELLGSVEVPSGEGWRAGAPLGICTWKDKDGSVCHPPQ
jgi:hypothetical protein